MILGGEVEVHLHDCLDDDPIGNDLVVVQDAHDEGGDVANRNSPEVDAASRSILVVVVEVVGHLVLNEANNHNLHPKSSLQQPFIVHFHATQ